MAWIESHQALGHHPKSLRLAELLRCSMPTAIGHLQYLWWWALDYAPDGLVAASDKRILAKACLWHGNPDRFFDALLSSGFVEMAGSEGGFRIHDWMDYAGRLLQKRAANVARTQRARQTHVTRNERITNAHVTGLPTNQPTNQPPVGCVGQSPVLPRAREPGPSGPLAAQAFGQDDDEPTPLPNGSKQCPLCPEVFTTTYDEHLSTSPRHKFRAEPEDFGRHTSNGTSTPDDPPVERLQPGDELRAEHERLQALERQRGDR